MKVRTLAMASAVLVTTAATAETIDAWLSKLDPQERSRQACIIRGMADAKKTPALRGADRMKSSIFNQAQLDGTKVVAKGAAVRIKGQWHAIAFECQLTADLMKATTFTFTLGNAIPKEKWESLGLW